MKKIIGLFCMMMIGVVSIKPIFADSLKGGFPVCVTKETYEQFVKAYREENKKEYQYLLEKNFCFLLPAGLELTVLDRSLLSHAARVRIFLGDEAMIFWTHTKNIKKE